VGVGEGGVGSWESARQAGGGWPFLGTLLTIFVPKLERCYRSLSIAALKCPRSRHRRFADRQTRTGPGMGL
jgi:hypothetical protein